MAKSSKNYKKQTNPGEYPGFLLEFCGKIRLQDRRKKVNNVEVVENNVKNIIYRYQALTFNLIICSSN